jgi:thermopsin
VISDGPIKEWMGDAARVFLIYVSDFGQVLRMRFTAKALEAGRSILSWGGAARILLVSLVSVLVVSSALSATYTGHLAAASSPLTSPLTAPSSPSSTPAAIPTSVPTPALGQLANRLAQEGVNHGTTSAVRLLPNLAYSSVREGAAIVPSNLAQGGVQPGPTSIGVNDLGLRVNSTGSYVPYWYRTTSLDGAITINNISLLPIMTNASSSITLQLNAVLNNVTIFGQSIYQIWAQNVIFYSVEGDQMQLATDAWNFTGPPGVLSANDLYEYSPGGMLYGGFVYVHAVPSSPPAFILRPPFTINFYLNATNIDGRNALYFNYSLVSAYDITLGGTDLGRSIQDGSFDWIIFNSTAGQAPGYTAPPASFLISGNESSGIGLPNDAEIAICGGSDGYSAITRTLDASAQLRYLNGSTGQYSAVPAAFTTTEDTGESMEGVDAHYTPASASQGAAYLTNGPEYIYGMWNATEPGIQEQKFTVTASPDSTLLWVSPKGGGGSPAFNDNQAAWDLAASPQNSFWLPTGPGQRFVIEGLANDYTPEVTPLRDSGTTHLTLAPNPAEGLYVPIIAYGNSGVASIAQRGDGSASDPYVISYVQTQPISSLFSVYDFFTQPLYPGLLLSGVTAHVTILDPPSLYIVQSPEAILVLETFYGLTEPAFNYLPMEIYDSSNISIVGARDISGWFPVTLTGFLYASLFLSNDTHMLVANNYFSSMGSSMVIVNPNGNATSEGNTVFGNVFVPNPLTVGPDNFYLVLTYNTTYTGPPGVGGLGVFSSGNTIYNNLFETPITAYSPPQNPYLAYVFINDFAYTDYAGVAATWENQWNISLEPRSYAQYVNGFRLSGSIVGAPFQGGNAWANWNGSIPYTDQGLITPGGDYLPLPLSGSPLQAVVFEEHGLSPGTLWTVTVGGTSYSSTGSLILAYEPAGTYHFSVAKVGGTFARPDQGVVHVSTRDVEVQVRFF